MTERVTIDVDPNVVRVLRAVAGESATGMAWVHQGTLAALADAIEAALPMPEPAAGSIVRLGDTPGFPLYARADDDGPGVKPFPWVGLTGDRLGDWESWSTLRRHCPVVVFDGATLEVGQ